MPDAMVYAALPTALHSAPASHAIARKYPVLLTETGEEYSVAGVQVLIVSWQ
jgi:hypothetical protein